MKCYLLSMISSYRYKRRQAPPLTGSLAYENFENKKRHVAKGLERSPM